MVAQNRMLHRGWDRYDTRHVVFRPVGMTSRQLEDGYWWAYRDVYRWSAIWRGAWTKPVVRDRFRHVGYAGGWKKLEPLWDLLIRTGQVLHALPVPESLLGSFGARRPGADKGHDPNTGQKQHPQPSRRACPRHTPRDDCAAARTVT